MDGSLSLDDAANDDLRTLRRIAHHIMIINRCLERRLYFLDNILSDRYNPEAPMRVSPLTRAELEEGSTG